MNKQLLKLLSLLLFALLLCSIEASADDYSYQGIIEIEEGETKYVQLPFDIYSTAMTGYYPQGKWVLSDNYDNAEIVSGWGTLQGCKVKGKKAGKNIMLTFSGNSVLYDMLWSFTGYYLIDVVSQDVKVTSISLNSSSISLKEGATKQLTATVSPSNATDKSVSWTSSNTSVASVSSSGLITAKSAGNSTITCKANDGSGKQATCSVTVTAADPIKVTGITLNYTSASMVVGDTKQLSASISPSNATDKSVTWTSSNTSFADVSSDGLVTAKSKGSTTITCKANDGSGKQATCSITVADPIKVTSITLNESSVILGEGKSKILTATILPSNATDKSVTWTSSNVSVATISNNGYVTAKTEGTCTITCKANDGSGNQATCNIIVKNIPIGEFVAKTIEGVEMTFYGYSDGTCYVYGAPAIDINTSGKITIPSEVSGSKVVKISGNAFSDCKGITEVIVPNTVEEIGYFAFKGCSSLTSVLLGTGVKILGSNAFQDCTSLTSISLNNSVTKVSYWAFHGCTSLSTITGFGNLEYIGSSAFGETPWVENLPEGQIYLGKIFYKYKGEIPDNTSFSFKNGTKGIADDAFYNCKGLVAVTIPESMNSITGTAFYGCDNLASIIVKDGNTTYDSRNNCNAIIETGTNTLIAGCKTTTIPGSVTKIGNDAFYRNGGITSMVIPNNIESIGSTAFWHCDNLQSLVIGKGLKTVSNSAFWYCSNLQTISIVTDNPYYDSRDNCNAIIETSKDELVVGCQTTVIPNSVKSIGTYAFMGYNTIYNLVIPNSVEKISSESFYQLYNLQTVVIGSGIKEIGEMSFYRCAKLENIYSLIDFPFDINENTFETTSWENYASPYENATLYVPIGSKFNYMTCIGWGRFKNIVEFDTSSFDPSTLGIHGVMLDNDKDAPVFDLLGRKLAQPKKGVNIINGKKVVVK